MGKRGFSFMIALLISLAVVEATVAQPTVNTVTVGALDSSFGKSTAAFKVRDPLDYSSTKTRLSDSVWVATGPGPDRVWRTADDVLIVCSTAGPTCTTITVGFLDDGRAPVRVNDTTAVVESVGADGFFCEDASANNGPANDIMIVLQNASTTNNIVRIGSGQTVNQALCLGTPAATPVPINQDAVGFAGPGDDRIFFDSDNAGDLDDEGVFIFNLTSGTPVVVRYNVGAQLGVHLTGAPGGMLVSGTEIPGVTDSPFAYMSSPGANGQYADSGDSTADDGVVRFVISDTSVTGSFVQLGRLAPAPQGRPVYINLQGTGGGGKRSTRTGGVPGGGGGGCLEDANDGPVVDDQGGAAAKPNRPREGGKGGHTPKPKYCGGDTLVVPDTGGNAEFMEDEETGHPVDERLHVVKNGVRVNTFTNLAMMHLLPKRVSDSTAVAFSSSFQGVDTDGDEFGINMAHIIRGLDVSNGTIIDHALPNSNFVKQVVVMNSNQVIYTIDGPWTAHLLHNLEGGAPSTTQADICVPTVSENDNASADCAQMELERINANTALFVVPKEALYNSGAGTGRPRVGMLRINAGPALNGTFLTEGATHSPAGAAVRLSDSKALVATPGTTLGNNTTTQREFCQNTDGIAGNNNVNCGDDGVIVISDLDTAAPSVTTVTVGNMCGGAMCRPLVLNPTTAVVGTVGANGQFDSENNEDDNDDGFGVIGNL